MEQQKPTDSESLRPAVVAFYQAEIDRRYTLEYLRTVPAITEDGLLDTVGQNDLETFKEFFKRVLYPSGEERARRDEAVEAVTGLLNDKSRVMGLLPKAPKLLLKHGPALATARQAGLELLGGYRSASRMEDELLAEVERTAREAGYDLRDSRRIPNSVFRTAFAAIPRSIKEDVAKRVHKLSTLAIRDHVVRATRDVLSELHAAVATDDEAWALEYAMSVLDEVRELARAYDREQVKRFLRVAELLEAHYLDEMETTYG
jgi:hypothetical protein